MFIIENITDIFLPIWTLWVRCVLFSEFEILIYALLSQNIDVEIYSLFGGKFWSLDLRAFVAKRLRPDLPTFSAIFFLTEKAVPQTFSLLECMITRCASCLTHDRRQRRTRTGLRTMPGQPESAGVTMISHQSHQEMYLEVTRGGRRHGWQWKAGRELKWQWGVRVTLKCTWKSQGRRQCQKYQRTPLDTWGHSKLDSKRKIGHLLPKLCLQFKPPKLSVVKWRICNPAN